MAISKTKTKANHRRKFTDELKKVRAKKFKKKESSTYSKSVKNVIMVGAYNINGFVSIQFITRRAIKL
jgi:predicted house-cleaning NTP pyrophosphatase (Maf/HAM1 superfamily)